MAKRKLERLSVAHWGDEIIAPGETRSLRITVSESYVGMNVRIPVQVRRAKHEGPTVFVTAALHGDEINGTGTIRHLIQANDLKLVRGNLILVPVLNLLGFDRHSRYLPDRRDLNRCFPGSPTGSLASRMAHCLFREIVMRSDFGIDLHTAAIRRTNFPNVRADLSNEATRRVAEAFGTECILSGRGPVGSFRREACRVGCPTIVMEGGEVWKVEPGIVASSVRGVMNVLRHLGMLDGEVEKPPHQFAIVKSRWLRAERGGFLQFHVKPGDLVLQNQPIATNTSLLGVEKNTLHSPMNGIVIGMTTLPVVAPGEPVCNLGMLPDSTDFEAIARSRNARRAHTRTLMDQLSTNVMVVEKSIEGHDKGSHLPE